MDSRVKRKKSKQTKFLELGNRIKRIREGSARLNQQEFSKKISVPYDTYVRYERGERDAPASVLAAIALEGNSIDAAWLLTGEGEIMRENSKEELSSRPLNIDRALGLCLDEIERLKAENERLIEVKKNLDQDEKTTEESG